MTMLNHTVLCRVRRTVAGSALAAALFWTSPFVAAQTPTAPVPVPDDTETDVPQIPKLTLAGLRDIDEALPDDIALVDGVHVISTQARGIYGDPGLYGFAPTVKAKAVVSLARGDEAPGSVLLIEYESEPDQDAKDFLGGLLWGPGGRSAQHPEQLIYSGRFVIILSFKPGTAAGEWYKTRLRTHFHLDAPRSWEHLDETMSGVFQAFGARDNATARKLLDEAGDAIDDYAYAQFMRGECAKQSEAGSAVTAYTRALELHDSYDDRLPSDLMLFACLDGLGIALLTDQQNAAATPVFIRTIELGEQLEIGSDLSATYYNLGCGYARLLQDAECHEALSRAFALDPTFREAATMDPDLERVQKLETFRDLFDG